MSIFTGRSFLTEDRMSREARKERLRKQIVSKEDDSREGRKRPSLLVYVIGLLAAAAIIYGIYYYVNLSHRESFSVSWETSIQTEENSDAETFRGYAPFRGGIIRYTKDGAEFIDKKGNITWERSYQMNSPIIDVSAEYAVIADQGSTQIFIFSGTELSGASETILPISLVRIADNGVVYAVLNDSDAEYITAFRADGSAIDLSVKSVINGDGYPFDIDTSPDGTELISSYVSIENGQIVNDVVFRNFGSVGQNEDARRVVGGFRDEFAGCLAGRVHFSTNEYSQAFYNGGIVFFSTKVLNSPEVLANVSFAEDMLAIAYSDDTVAVLLDNSAAARAAANISNADGKARASDKKGGSGKADDSADNGKSDNSSAKSDGAGEVGSSSAGAKSGQTEAANASEVGDENKKTLITAGNSSAPYRLVIFNNKGTVTGEADIDFGYKGLCIGGGYVIVYGTHEIRTFGSRGNLRGSFTYDEAEISNITAGSDSGIMYLVSGNTIKQLKY